MTQADLARAADIAPAQLSRYEVGKAIPRHEVVTRLAKALEVDVVDLLATEGQKVTIVVPPEMMDVLKVEARRLEMTLEEAVENRLASSFYPDLDEELDKEHMDYLQSVVTAFQATSDDFRKELGERMAKHLETVMSKVSKKSKQENP